jgi:protein-tyrosine phosphatase
MRVLVVCLGNICRSPIGEGLLRHHAAIQGVRLKAASAGTSGLHQGEAPDRRSIEVMRRNGIDISAQRSAQVSLSDFTRFDMILAMDERNEQDLHVLADQARRRGEQPCPIARFDPSADVPDPYYGGSDGFTEVYTQVDAAAKLWVEQWKKPAN